MIARVVKSVCLIIAIILFQGCQMNRSVKRFGQLAQIKPGQVEIYKDLYDKIWPEVVEELKKYNVQNYSIYMKQLEVGHQPYLFGYFEYTGTDFDADMAKMMENPTVQKWEDTAGGECLEDMSPDGKGLWWAEMEEVFYTPGDTETKIDNSKVQHYGSVIGVRPEVIDAYKLIHKYPWPPVMDAIKRGKIRNYPIYLHEIDGKLYLFGYFEYVGDSFAADMAIVDGDPATKAWIKFTDQVCQLPIPTRDEGEWWANMESVFYME